MSSDRSKALAYGLDNQNQEDEQIDIDVDESAISRPTDTPRDQELQDEEMFRVFSPTKTNKGVYLFLSNDYSGAEKVFSSKSHIDPLYALGSSALLYIKALMTFNEEDIKNATSSCDECEAISNVQANYYAEPLSISSVISNITSFLMPKKDTVIMSNGEMRAIICKAESSLLCVTLHLLQESIFGFVKAGFKMRKGYKAYTYGESIKFCNLAWAEFQKAPEPVLDHYDVHTLSEVGFSFLRKSFDTNGVRSGMASLFTLIIYQLQISFAPHIYMDQVLPKAKELLRLSLERWPKSALHLYMAARFDRGERRLVESSLDYKKCSESQDHWKELNYLCAYEMGMNDCFLLDFESASKHMEQLYQASYWSKAFYCYFYAACLDMLSLTNFNATTEQRAKWKSEAIELYKKVPDLVVRKFGGKNIGIELYVSRKVKTFERDNFQRTLLPVLELIGLWNGYRFMPLVQLKTVKELLKQKINQIENEFGASNNSNKWSRQEIVERSATLYMTLGAVHRELEEFSESDKQYQWGILYYLQNNQKAMKKSFKNAKKYSDYNFEFRLEFRIHLALLEIERRNKEIEKSGNVEDEDEE